jgi:hypothetical protein
MLGALYEVIGIVGGRSEVQAPHNPYLICICYMHVLYIV